jgi:hypothetical protein
VLHDDTYHWMISNRSRYAHLFLFRDGRRDLAVCKRAGHRDHHSNGTYYYDAGDDADRCQTCQRHAEMLADDDTDDDTDDIVSIPLYTATPNHRRMDPQ